MIVKASGIPEAFIFFILHLLKSIAIQQVAQSAQNTSFFFTMSKL